MRACVCALALLPCDEPRHPARRRYSGWSDAKKVVVARPGVGVRHLCGLDLLDNHAVNFVAAASTSALGALAASVWLAG